jgi:hypothetical protein
LTLAIFQANKNVLVILHDLAQCFEAEVEPDFFGDLAVLELGEHFVVLGGHGVILVQFRAYSKIFFDLFLHVLNVAFDFQEVFNLTTDFFAVFFFNINQKTFEKMIAFVFHDVVEVPSEVEQFSSGK